MKTMKAICLAMPVAMMMSLSACSLTEMLLQAPAADAMLERTVEAMKKGGRQALADEFDQRLVDVQARTARSI